MSGKHIICIAGIIFEVKTVKYEQLNYLGLSYRDSRKVKIVAPLNLSGDLRVSELLIFSS